MDNTLLYYGESLPIIFAQGYLYAFEGEVGRPTATACWQVVTHERIPNHLERTAWLVPLMPYWEGRLAEREPLDFMLVSLFQMGLNRMHMDTPYHEAIVKRYIRNIGISWWRGCAPVCVCALDRISLRVLFTPSLWHTLDVWKWGGPRGASPAAKSRQELAILGLQTFIETFHQQTGIAGHFIQRQTELEWTISKCPFCLHQSLYCQIFWGIIEGVIEWLHSTDQFTALPTTLQINERQSTSHNIRIDLQ